MKTNSLSSCRAALYVIGAGLLFLRGAVAGDQPSAETLASEAQAAISSDASEAAAAIQALREAGPTGLQAFSESCAADLAAHAKATGDSKGDAKWERVRSAFDAVGQQRDDYTSQLYWFTDLEKAKTAARAAGKPILSLRLLGKLNEEYSCANSRFFRTTLYANAEVSRYLRENFILHWQSERPVPVITIDMGDGREIKRTITGNSIHYILDADGHPIDALPGLYGAKAFLAGLSRAVTAEQAAAGLEAAPRTALLKKYHAAELARIQAEWAVDLAKVGTGPQPAIRLENAKVPNAMDASLRAMSKTGVERPMLQSLQITVGSDQDRLNKQTGDSTWTAIAALHFADAAMDASAERLVQEKQPDLAPAMVLTTSKMLVETPLSRTLRNLTRSIAEDTVRNEYQLHAQLHEWFVNGTAPANLDTLNAKVYAELFLTPDSDPWLGLAPADMFSALDKGGLIGATKR
jgi:hypothetical protein